jgi:hypothetical protein
MSAPNVAQIITRRPNVQRSEYNPLLIFRPRYARDLIWTHDEPSRLTLARSTEFEPPVPSPPSNELSNNVALKTIHDNPHLFKIVTPINVDIFQSYLAHHPNQPFVQSVCRGLREGFWPWANTDFSEWPITYDNSYREIKNETHRVFLIEQIEAEVELEQFSPAFGPDLLPGMHSQPVGVVPKPHSDKFRMVVDQSAEPFSLNSTICKGDGKVHLDNMHDLGSVLRRVRHSIGQNT